MTWRRRLRRWWQARRDRRRLLSLGVVLRHRSPLPFVTDRSDCHAGD